MLHTYHAFVQLIGAAALECLQRLTGGQLVRIDALQAHCRVGAVDLVGT